MASLSHARLLADPPIGAPIARPAGNRRKMARSDTSREARHGGDGGRGAAGTELDPRGRGPQ
jgi:hypothetical protein